jgi:ABC-type xylose transport system substrate-binding protein
VKLVVSDAQQDNSKQIAQVETFIWQKLDLLIIAPLSIFDEIAESGAIELHDLF